MSVIEQSTIHIKNMVCLHCGEVLRQKLSEAGFSIKKIQLGKLELEDPVDDKQFGQLSEIALQNGFEIISDNNSKIVEQVKHLIIDIIHQRETPEGNLSDFLEQKIYKDYQFLSRLFSSVEGKSIERYFILQKIERAKELIVYGEQTLAQIAYDLRYSNQQHFSRQFKKETGLSTTHFKKIKENKRTSIDRL